MKKKMKLGTTRKTKKAPRVVKSPSVPELQDAIGQIVAELSFVDTLANAAAHVAARIDDDQTCRRRLGDLVVQIENASGKALATAQELKVKLSDG